MRLDALSDEAWQECAEAFLLKSESFTAGYNSSRVSLSEV